MNFRLLLSASEVPAGRVFGLDTQTLYSMGIMLFNVALLALILSWLLYKPVRTFLAERSERIRNDIESARKNNEESQELKANYKKLLDNIAKEREEILAEARKQAVKEHDKMIFEAQEEAISIRKKAAGEIEIERKNAADDIKRQIIDISTVMAARFVAKEIDKKTRDEYIADALADWSERIWT